MRRGYIDLFIQPLQRIHFKFTFERRRLNLNSLIHRTCLFKFVQNVFTILYSCVRYSQRPFQLLMKTWAKKWFFKFIFSSSFFIQAINWPLDFLREKKKNRVSRFNLNWVTSGVKMCFSKYVLGKPLKHFFFIFMKSQGNNIYSPLPLLLRTIVNRISLSLL